MAEGVVTGYIGCPECRTVLFEIVSTPTGSRGVFENATRAREGAPAGASQVVCATCEGALCRVSGP